MWKSPATCLQTGMDPDGERTLALEEEDVLGSLGSLITL